MKKKVILVFCIFVIIFTATILLQNQRTTYVLSPDMSLALFGTEPEEFFLVDREVYNNCEDLRKCAEIDETGNLILRLTKEQEKAILSYYDSDLKSFDALSSVELFDGYAGLKITGDKESISHVIANEFRLLTIDDMAFRQMFNGTDPKDISVTVIVVESGSNSVLYEATWPQEDIVLSPKSWNFTSNQ